MVTRASSRPSRAPAALTAYVLHRYDWSESSLILDVFTRDQGRLVVAAKGAKRPYSQLRSVLLPFQRVHLSLGRVPRAAADAGEYDLPTREVQTLRGAEWAGGAAMLTGAALFSGFYLNELLMKLLARQDAHPLLFDAYAQTLPALAQRDEARVQSALRAFEITLLQQVGVLPDLSLVTTTLEAVFPDGRYALLPEAGVAAARPEEASVSGTALVDMQAALLHGSLPALQQACSSALPEWKGVLRGLLHYHLGAPVLRTRQVMLELQTLALLPSNTARQRPLLAADVGPL
ncbi:MAG: recombination protein O N-terminal domain-containing protein [Pseudomonadota bacterium]|nr:recombination protein O N-terminal domain-containing protein [Pseudomonadota bacterium]